jgi:hypothetical protein
MSHLCVLSAVPEVVSREPRFQSLFQRAVLTTGPAFSWPEWLESELRLPLLPAAAWMHLPGEVSTIAANDGDLRAEAVAKVVPVDHTSLLIAEPIHLRVERDGLVMTPLAEEDAITTREATQWVATLNQYFRDQGWRFTVLSATRWLVVAPRPLTVTTTAAARLPGQQVFEHVPTGQDARVLRQIMNEVQMLFHEHSLNGQRQGAGQLPVSGIWFWGHAALPPPRILTARTLVGRDPIATGMAMWGGANWSPDWPDRGPLRKDVLLMDTLAPSATAALRSALQAVDDGEFERLTWVSPRLSGTQVWHWQRRSRLFFWRTTPLPQHDPQVLSALPQSG